MSKKSWYLPTNTENLEVLLSSGLITCKKGFPNNSYLQDIIADSPNGYIPIFSADNLSEAITKSCSEDSNLTCCILEFDLDQIENLEIYGEANFDVENTKKNCHFKLNSMEETEQKQYKKILIPSPLPIQCIKKVIVENSKLKTSVSRYFEDKFAITNNFWGANAKLFKIKEASDDLPFPKENEEENYGAFCLLPQTIAYEKISSLGGMLGLMFYQTKNSRDSVNAFKDICTLKPINNKGNVFEYINNYFYGTYFEDNEYMQPCYELLKIVSEHTGQVSQVKFSILEYLDSANNSPEKQTLIAGLAKKLRDIEDRVNQEPPEALFTKLIESDMEEKRKNIFMLLLMYFFRDKSETMLKFYHDKFQPIDYMIFSMFYGVGCKYIGLPSLIKKTKGLDYFISNRMAEYAHLSSNCDTPIYKIVKPPKFLLTDLIKDKSNGKYDDFVRWLSEFLNIDSQRFISWEMQGNDFICSSRSSAQLEFTEEPLIDTELDEQQLNIEIEGTTDTSKEGIKQIVKKAMAQFQTWKIQIKQVTCKGKTTLKFKQKPKLVSLIDMAELEKEIVMASIGNEKDLFDYNEVFTNADKRIK